MDFGLSTFSRFRTSVGPMLKREHEGRNARTQSGAGFCPSTVVHVRVEQVQLFRDTLITFCLKQSPKGPARSTSFHFFPDDLQKTPSNVAIKSLAGFGHRNVHLVKGSPSGHHRVTTLSKARRMFIFLQFLRMTAMGSRTTRDRRIRRFVWLFSPFCALRSHEQSGLATIVAP